MAKFIQGKYSVLNINKYKGDPTKVKYRSSWELKFMKWCDSNSSVIEWNSEEVIIPYRSPLDSRVHRYFVDFYVKVKTKGGLTERWLVEIKPKAQTKAPKVQKRKTKRYIQEVATYAVNERKWEAAENWCKDRGYKFKKVTEVDLNIRY
jgi:hypothetical protein